MATVPNKNEDKIRSLHKKGNSSARFLGRIEEKKDLERGLGAEAFCQMGADKGVIPFSSSRKGQRQGEQCQTGQNHRICRWWVIRSSVIQQLLAWGMKEVW